MSCSTIATIHHAEGVRIDDVDALNRELMDLGNMSFGELYSPRSALLPEWRGPFMIDGNDEILIADAESEGQCEYGSSTQVWACWSRSVTDAIARHLMQGEIVFEIVEEGQPYEYLVITPGSFDVRDDY